MNASSPKAAPVGSTIAPAPAPRAERLAHRREVALHDLAEGRAEHRAPPSATLTGVS